MPKIRCGACHHWDAGECYRYPPSMVRWPMSSSPTAIYQPHPTRPAVAEDERACGEYTPQGSQL